MNTITKRWLCMLVVMAMVLSMSPVITLPAAAAADPGAELKATVDAWVAETNAAGTFAAGGDVVAKCPVCNADVTWKDVTANVGTKNFMGAATGTNIHVYLSANATNADATAVEDAFSSTTSCLYLNGKTLTTSSYFKVRGTFSIIGGDGGKIERPSTGSTTMLFETKGTSVAFNIFGGTITDNVSAATLIELDTSKPVYIYGATLTSTAGTVFTNPDCSTGALNLYNGTVINGSAYGPALKVTRGTVNMYDGVTVNGGTVTTSKVGGAAVSLLGSCTFNMEGGKILNGGATYYGGNISITAGTFNMKGGEIAGGHITGGGWGGGNVYVKGGTFNMEGGKIYNGTSDLRGGNICVDSGTLTMTGGEIYNGTASGSRNGGNVYINSGTFTMSGGSVYNGTAGGKGGNIYVDRTSGVLAMSGNAQVYGGTATGSYPEICLNGATMTMADNATVTAKANGVAVGIERYASGSGSSLTMSGNASIVSETGGNMTVRVYNLEDDRLTFADGWAGTCYLFISGTGYAAGTALPAAVSYSGTFAGNLYLTTGDEGLDNYPVKVVDGALTVQEPAPAEPEKTEKDDYAEYEGKARVDAWVANNSGETFSSGYCPVCNELVTWTEVEGDYSTDVFKTLEHAYLSGNANYTGTSLQYVADGVTTCIYLNGKTLTSNNGFYLRGAANIIGGNGKIVVPAEATGTGPMFKNLKKVAVNFYGGTYENNTAMDMFYGDVTDGDFNLYGGTYTTKGNFFNMYYGTNMSINGADITVSGGYGISYRRAADVVMNGGSLTYTGEEAVVANGGLINMNYAGATFTMNGGTLSGGKATTKGGNIYAGAGSTATLSGDAVVSGGTCPNSNNIWLEGATLNMSGNAKIIDVHNENYGAVNGWYSGSNLQKVTLADNASVATTPEKAAEGTARLIRIYNSTGVDTLEIAAGWAGEAYIYHDGNKTFGDALAADRIIAKGAFTGNLYHSGVKVFLSEGNLVLASALRLKTAAGLEQFQTAEEALAAYKAAEVAAYLELAGDAAFAIDGAIVLDVVTYTAEISGNGTVSVLSRSNDDYEGYGYVLPADEVVVAKDATNPINGNRYIAIADEKNAEGGYYSAHRVVIKLTAVTLRAAEAGLYYKAAYTCDDVLASRVSTYGVILNAKATPGVEGLTAGSFSALTDFAPAEDTHTVEGTSCAVWGIMKDVYSGAENLGRAQNKIYANAYFAVDIDDTDDNDDDYIVLADTENVGTQNGIGYSLVDALKAIDNNWANYSEAQQQMVKDFAAEWAGLEGEKAVDWSGCEFTNIA